MNMKLLILGDLHYSATADAGQAVADAKESFYRAALERFLEMDADFHISIGDLTDNGVREEYETVARLVRNTNRRFVHVLGNHDAYRLSKTEIAALLAHPRYWAVEGKDADLLFLDTTKELDLLYGGDVDDEQLHWLEERIRLAGDKPLLLFGHHPVYHTTSGSDVPRFSIEPDSRIAGILAQKQGIGLYFNGHNHWNSIARQAQWHYVQTGAPLNILSVRCVEITADSIATRMIRMEDPAFSRREEVISGLTYFKPLLDSAHGSPADRELIVNFVPSSI